ncbi:hypothetical protein CLIB1423_01S02696 [[Candida] railenensis]|uniref:Uncharacterized protein n=1 Tax=[Candida] railenensis TaxID=45579 RepID=A0A9P0QK33_9ASCO|nr:hypothetical protein CLIB1423_01S02696 [[Candida] railenensis]
MNYYIAYPFNFIYGSISFAIGLAFSFFTYPFRYIPVLTNLSYSIFLTPIVKLLDIIVYSITLPFKPALYLLGIDVNNLREVVPHVEFLVANLYQFVAVAVLVGIILGVLTGLTLGLISFVLTPRNTKHNLVSHQKQQPLGQSQQEARSQLLPSHPLIANIPNKQLPLSFSDFKIDIKYDTPSPERRSIQEEEEIRGLPEPVQPKTIELSHHPMKRSSAIDYHHDTDLKNRFDNDSSLKTENDLFTARTEDTDITYATNQIKNYSK